MSDPTVSALDHSEEKNTWESDKLTWNKEGSVWSGRSEVGGNHTEIESVGDRERDKLVDDLVGRQLWLSLQEYRDGSADYRSRERRPAQTLRAVVAEKIGALYAVARCKYIDTGTVVCGEI